MEHNNNGSNPSSNNDDILDRISQLPEQNTEDPFVNQLFNGSSFY